jgi:hypothetical protein
LDYVFGSDAWSVLLICLTQDLPFFIIRFYVITKYSKNLRYNYTIYFFFLKSFVLLVLEIYRVISLIHQDIQLSKSTTIPSNNIEQITDV